MNRWKWVQICLAATIFASLTMIVVLQPGRLLSALLSVWIVAVVYVLLRYERMLRDAEHHSLLIRTMNHHRHDWMNDLQVLFGYIRLKKYDILPEYVDKIKIRLSAESMMSKLGVPSLIAYLLSFRAGKRNLALELEIDQDIHLDQLPIDGTKLAGFIRDTVELFDRKASYSSETNSLSVQFDLEGDSLLLDFAYEGEYDPALGAELKQLLKTRSLRFETEEIELGERVATAAIRVPFHT